jgi:hypothetical protein
MGRPLPVFVPRPRPSWPLQFTLDSQSPHGVSEYFLDLSPWFLPIGPGQGPFSSLECRLTEIPYRLYAIFPVGGAIFFNPHDHEES